MPAWTPAPYSLPYIAANDVLEQTPATNKAQMEKISEYLSQIESAAPPIGGIISWALPWNPSDTPDDYSNVSRFAPEYLPCTGVVYPRTRAPELCDAIGHIYVDGDPDVGDVGDYVSGAALNKHHGSGYENTGIYKRTGAGFDLVEADGFCTPDLRGRSPMGTNPDGNNEYYGQSSGPTSVRIELGARDGDWRVHDHDHRVTSSAWDQVMRLGKEINPSSFQVGSRYQTVVYGPHDATAPAVYAKTWPHETAYGQWPGYPLEGQGRNLSPITGVNFLIACGVSGSATPSTRSGEVHRLHAVTSAHMIRQRLADPSLSDDERGYLEATLAGEPWPPPVNP